MEGNRIRVPDFKKMKRRARKITMLTAYDATMARLLDRAGLDALLVGDSLGMVVLGHETTLPVTLDAMIHHTSAVSRGTERALVIADMPFLTYQVTVSEAVRNAGRLLQEGGAAAVKIEGGRPMLDVVRRLVDVGIPGDGTRRASSRSRSTSWAATRSAARSRRTATRSSRMPRRSRRRAPSRSCSNRFLPSSREPSRRASAYRPSASARDPIATARFSSATTCSACSISAPSFVKQYARLGDEIVAATEAYIEDVQAGRYPAAPAKAVGGRTT